MARRRRQRKNERAVLKLIVRAVAGNLLSAVRTTPLGILLIAGIGFLQIKALPASMLSSIPTISYVTLTFGMIITSCFNRSRAFFILLFLFLSQLGMFYTASRYGESSFLFQGYYDSISLLIPVNLLFFASVSERGLLSARGKKYFAFIFLQGFFLLEMILAGDREFFEAVGKSFMAARFMPQTFISDGALIAFMISGVVLLAERRAPNAGFKTAVFGALISLALAQHFHSLSVAIPFFYAVAGFIIVLSVLQDYYCKAYVDELTGLPSRRLLNEDLMKLDGTYTIAMLDVDFFKKFNDTYGHDAGDDVLRLISGAMKEFKAGKSFRYGGEEFTILFPGKSLAEVIPHLEDLREAIARRKFILRGKQKGADRKLSVTVSIGAAETNQRTANPEEVIKQADKALYRAKENGRNCVSK